MVPFTAVAFFLFLLSLTSLLPRPVLSLTLSNLFSSNMILQRGPEQARVWGTASPASTVTLSLDSTKLTTTASAAGDWSLALPAQPASHGRTITVQGDGAALTLSDVAFGDVYLCSGQSNMQANLNFSWGGAEAIAASTHYPNMRLFNVPPQYSNTTLRSTNISYADGWVAPSSASLVCESEPAPCLWTFFSAACYYTGQALYDRLNGSVPIGLLQSAYGGTGIAAWTSKEADEICGPIPPRPGGPSKQNPENDPSACFNAMIHPLLPITLRAILWWQGESDGFDADRYSCAFPMLIEDWRLQFQQPSLPFYFVLLNAYRGGDNQFPTVRQSQLRALALPHTGAANAIDLGDEASPAGAVHSRNKSYVGERLARWLLRDVYHERVLVTGPRLTDASGITMMTTASRNVVVGTIRYGQGEENAELHVMATPGCETCCMGGAGLLTAQVLNSTDRTVYSPVVTVSLDGRTLQFTVPLSTPLKAVAAELTLRFQWADYPECVLYNSELLPAEPWSFVVPVNATTSSAVAVRHSPPRAIVRSAKVARTRVAAGLTVSNFFSSNMILQRAPLSAKIWGTAAPAATVSLSLDGAEPLMAKAEASGYWLITLDPQRAGLGHTIVISSDGVSVNFTGVAFGDVYLCSGQSNMQINLNFSFGGAEAIEQYARYPNMRLFNMPQQSSDSPLNTTRITFPQGWLPPSPASLACGAGCLWNQFSAVCWYAGRDVYDRLNGSVPIGLLHGSYGGTVVEAWTSPTLNSRCGPIPANPPGSNPVGQNNASACYNAMIYPMLPMTFSAVLWFDAARYACAFPAMIEDWRAKFQSPRLPFFFVLLAAYRDGGANTVALRNSQLAALTLPYTGVASAIDAGDEASPQGAIHPRMKAVVGVRLARWLLRDLYHEAVMAAGPARPDEGQVVVVASSTALRAELKLGPGEWNAGLRIMPTPGCTTCCRDGTGLFTLQVVNSTDRQVYSPAVTVDERSAALSLTATLSQPLSPRASVTLSLQWSSYPECVLYNGDGVPASPWSLMVPVGTASESLTMPNLFSSNMVLQREPYNATLWGTAAALVTVTVRLNGTSVASATADALGQWRLSLPRQKASLGNLLEVGDGTTMLTYRGVAFGDVYLCSGQSNMEANLNFSFGGAEAIAASVNYPNMRLFDIPHQSSAVPLDIIPRLSYREGWVLPSNRTLTSGIPGDTMGFFSAACWYTGRDVYDSLNGTVAIGLLASTFGGTVVEAWTSIERNAECGPIAPLAPNENNPQNQPAGCYNAMIHPLLPFTISAILWYQGENNRYQAGRYGCAFPVMIEDWRAKFHQPELPFYFVLLAAEGDSSESTSILRDGQLQALRLPYTGVANAIDLGDPTSPIGAVHSRNKSYTGDRLARLLRHELYHLPVVDQGPLTSLRDVFVTVSADGAVYQLDVEFRATQVNDGLFIMNTPHCTSCCDLKTSGLLSVQLVNVSRPLWPALTLDPAAKTLTANVSVVDLNGAVGDGCAGVQRVMRVRLEWEGYPQCALYNAAMLPSVPWTVDVAVDTTALVCPGDGGEKGGWGMSAVVWGILVVAGLVLVGAAVAILLVKRRRGGSGWLGSRGDAESSSDAYDRLDERREPLNRTAPSA